uniref:G-protein coupled receptors family 2 profile 2 domain-containing protein n=1 Tax=Strigamia maritima TaxID=126957 RepID=T1JDI4_STRMM
LPQVLLSDVLPHPFIQGKEFCPKYLNCSCNHCYYVVENKEKQNKAGKECTRKDMQLPEFFEEDEMIFVQNWLKPVASMVGVLTYNVFTSAEKKPLKDFTWGPPMYTVVANWTNLSSSVSGFKSGDLMFTVLNSTKDFPNSFCNITQLSEAVSKRLMDIENGTYIDEDILHLLNRLIDIQSRLTEAIREDILDKYFAIQSYLIKDSHEHKWQAMGWIKVHKEVTKLTNLVEDNTKWLCKKKDRDIVRFEVAELSFFENKRFTWCNALDNNWTAEITTPKYIKNGNDNNFALVGALYKTLHNLLHNADNNWKIQSPIFTVKLANEEKEINTFDDNDTMLVTLPTLTYGQRNLYERTDAEFILTLICGSISVLSIWTLRATITKNLCITLSLGTIFLLTGMEHVSNQLLQTLCFVIAIALHYFYLSAFTWMGIEGHYLYLLLVKVFKTKSNYKTRYYLIGYGFPAVVVIFSAGIEPSGYGNEKYCWLRMNTGFNWVFLGPVLFTIMLNVIFLALAIRSALSVKALNDDKSSLKIRRYIKGAVSLTTLLGITWIFGYFNFLDKTKTLTYIFIILNGLQGLFIFIFHCISNENVKRVLMKNLLEMFWKHPISKSKIGSSGSAQTQTSCAEIRMQQKLTAANSSSSATSDVTFSISVSANHMMY